MIVFYVAVQEYCPERLRNRFIKCAYYTINFKKME